MLHEIQYLLKKWQLSNLRSFPHIAMTNNYVVIVYSEQYEKNLVLKIGLKKVIDKEIAALQYFQGDTSVKVLHIDQERLTSHSALLLEYIQPGNSLKDLFLQGQEEESIAIFADVVKKMHAHPKKYDGEKFQTVQERVRLLHNFVSTNDRLIRLLPRASALADKLVANQGQQYLLHGDLHHENILQNGDAWVMIDPQGIIGELEYEVGAFIRNPLFELLDEPNLERLILYRFERLSQFLNLDKQRVIDWSFGQAILAACFTEESKNDKGQNYFLTIGELIEKYTTI